MKIACDTCYYRKKDGPCIYANMNEDVHYLDIFEFCLVDVSSYERKTFKHHKYPHFRRNNIVYQYLKWKPKDETIDILLSDEDFEI